MNNRYIQLFEFKSKAVKLGGISQQQEKEFIRVIGRYNITDSKFPKEYFEAIKQIKNLEDYKSGSVYRGDWGPPIYTLNLDNEKRGRSEFICKKSEWEIVKKNNKVILIQELHVGSDTFILHGHNLYD
jgi:hypothetical protein